MSPSDPDGEQHTVQKANELYWDSDLSVNRIADELGLSKGRLYDAIRPLDSGKACPRCGNVLVFQNRTARQRKSLFCTECELEAEAGEVRSPEGKESLWVGAVNEPPAADRTAASTRFLLGGTLLGAAASALVAAYLWRR